MTLRHLGTAAALVAAAVCAGCGGSAGQASPDGPTHSSTHSSTHSPTPPSPTSTPTAGLHLSTATVKRDAHLGPAAINAAGDVAWTEGPTHAYENEVRVLRQGSSAPTTVARSAWREGLINWVALSGSWVVYVDK